MITNEQKKWAEDFFNKCEAKLDRVVDVIKTDEPITVSQGEPDYIPGIKYNWMCGFWGGMMWLLYLQTGKEKGLSGTISGGSSDTYFGRSGGSKKEKWLFRFTLVGSIIFVVLTIVLTILLTGGTAA